MLFTLYFLLYARLLAFLLNDFLSTPVGLYFVFPFDSNGSSKIPIAPFCFGVAENGSLPFFNFLFLPLLFVNKPIKFKFQTK